MRATTTICKDEGGDILVLFNDGRIEFALDIADAQRKVAAFDRRLARKHGVVVNALTRDGFTSEELAAAGIKETQS